jgi:hypothetical protein
MFRFLIPAAMLALAATAVTAAPPRVVIAAGRWAALRGDTACEAASLALLSATRTRAQGRASLAFEPGKRHGEFAALLSRPARPGAAVILTIDDTPFLLVARGTAAWSRGPAQEAAIIAAMRSAGGMRIEARGLKGGRFIDRYALDGAPTAIDAAAACAASL